MVWTLDRTLAKLGACRARGVAHHDHRFGDDRATADEVTEERSVMRCSPFCGEHRPVMVNESLNAGLGANSRRSCPARRCRRRRPGRDAACQRFHHDPRIDFEDLPGAVDLNEVDRAEADADRTLRPRPRSQRKHPAFAWLEQELAARPSRGYGASSAPAAGPTENPIERGLIEIAGHGRTTPSIAFRRRGRKRQFQQRMPPSPMIDGPVLAINDQRVMIEQDHPDFVFDIQVRRDARDCELRRKSCARRVRARVRWTP